MRRYIFIILAALSLAVIWSLSRGVWADAPAQSQAPGPVFERRTPVVLAVQRCGPAVVNIATRRETVERDPFFLGLPDVFLKNLPPGAAEHRRVVQSLGSGVLIHEDGYIVTNAHVVQSGGEIKVLLADKREFDATLVSADTENDLAIIKISDGKAFPAAQLGTSSDLMAGETVIAIGNPFGYTNTVSTGVVSAVDRTLDFEGGVKYEGLIQVDAPINPGNSGGALLNINGEVIGINVAIRADAEGIGFAIPVDRVREDLARLLNFRNVKRLWLGARLTEDRRKDAAGRWWSTVRVADVERDSPAAKSGLATADVLENVGPHAVRSLLDFETEMMRRAVGDTIKLRISRGGAEKTLEVTLGQAPKPDGAKLALERLGLHLEQMTAALAKKGRSAIDSGLMVTGVERDSSAAKAGFEAGDVIVQANTHRLKETTDLGYVLSPLEENAKVVLQVVRGRFAVHVAVPVRGKPNLLH